jgi:putative addiction module component (TIGR02574 family)
MGGNCYLGGAALGPTSTSVFDLSPSEKLQLVEDLWDDLAANLADVPVHEWQKEELDRRKANLLSRQIRRTRRHHAYHIASCADRETVG